MLLKDLKSHFIQAMKDKNKVKKELLSVIIGKIDNDGQLKQEVSENKEKEIVLNALQAFHKNLIKSQSDFLNKTDEKSKAFIEKTTTEIKILEELLPQKMTVEQLTSIIQQLHKEGLDPKQILTKLKQDFNGLYDGKVAFELTKTL